MHNTAKPQSVFYKSLTGSLGFGNSSAAGVGVGQVALQRIETLSLAMTVQIRARLLALRTNSWTIIAFNM
eukprot:685079-Amphidinium_carterae.2